jgi:hypothetical protein
LSIDADERVTEALKRDILTIMNNKTITSAFEIPRLSSYCGRFIKYGDWRHDKVIRLFRRSSGKFSTDAVHEKFYLFKKTSIGKIASPVLHYSFRSLEEVLNKINEYSSVSAEIKCQKGQRSSIMKALYHAAWSFMRGYLLRFGCLDGREGFLLAVSNAAGVFYRYTR